MGWQLWRKFGNPDQYNHITIAGPAPSTFNSCDFFACGTATTGVNSFHQSTDANGVTWDVGDYDGEMTCQSGGVTCAVWNALTQTWEEVPVPVIEEPGQPTPQSDNASALAKAMNQTGIQNLANPCTTIAWLGGSALAGAGGAAYVGREAVAEWAVTSGLNWATQKWINFLWQGARPGAGIIAVGRMYGKMAWDGGKAACNAMQAQ